MDQTIRIVSAWQEAANNLAVDELLALSAPEIELRGPRGVAHGHELLRAWAGRAGLTLTTRRRFTRGASVVAEQHGAWRSPETGEPMGEATVATWFRVADGRVELVARFDTLADALAAAGLSEADAVAEGA